MRMKSDIQPIQHWRDDMLTITGKTPRLPAFLKGMALGILITVMAGVVMIAVEVLS